jgi:hypothetical protein
MNSHSMEALLFPAARYIGLWFLLMAYINDAVRNSNHRASKWLDKSEQKKNPKGYAKKQSYFKGPHIFLNSEIHLKILGASKGDMKEVPCWGPG